MDRYQPISRQVYEYIEELHLLKQPCNLTFIDDYQKKTLLNAVIIDLFTDEDGEENLILEGGIRIRLDQILAINGKPVQYFV